MPIQRPGVHVQEVPGGPRAIAGVPTGVLGVAGRSARGPGNRSWTVTSLAEYAETFGDPACPGALDGAVADFFAQGGSIARVVRVEERPSRSDDGRPVAAPFLDALDALGDGERFDLLALPLAGAEAGLAHRLNGSALELARDRRAFLLLEPPVAWVDPPRDAREARMELGLEGLPMEALHDAAVHWPRLRRANGTAASQACALAGLFARTDTMRGVWKAPAGIEASLLGLGLERSPDEAAMDALRRAAVNPLRQLPGAGTVAWGARTLAGAAGSTDEFRHVPVRRLALFLEESIERGLAWTVFEPNAEPLWASVRQTVGAFLDGLFRQGALAGSSPKEAWFVACGADTMTERDRAEGHLRAHVGFAPLKPAEFVVLSFEARAGCA